VLADLVCLPAPVDSSLSKNWKITCENNTKLSGRSDVLHVSCLFVKILQKWVHVMQFVSYGEMQGVDVRHALQNEGERRWKTLGHVTCTCTSAFNLMWCIKTWFQCAQTYLLTLNKLFFFSPPLLLLPLSRLNFNTFYTEQLERLCADRSLADSRKEEISG